MGTSSMVYTPARGDPAPPAPKPALAISDHSTFAMPGPPASAFKPLSDNHGFHDVDDTGKQSGLGKLNLQQRNTPGPRSLKPKASHLGLQSTKLQSATPTSRKWGDSVADNLGTSTERSISQKRSHEPSEPDHEKPTTSMPGLANLVSQPRKAKKPKHKQTTSRNGSPMITQNDGSSFEDYNQALQQASPRHAQQNFHFQTRSRSNDRGSSVPPIRPEEEDMLAEEHQAGLANQGPFGTEKVAQDDEDQYMSNRSDGEDDELAPVEQRHFRKDEDLQNQSANMGRSWGTTPRSKAYAPLNTPSYDTFAAHHTAPRAHQSLRSTRTVCAPVVEEPQDPYPALRIRSQFPDSDVQMMSKYENLTYEQWQEEGKMLMDRFTGTIEEVKKIMKTKMERFNGILEGIEQHGRGLEESQAGLDATKAGLLEALDKSKRAFADQDVEE